MDIVIEDVPLHDIVAACRRTRTLTLQAGDVLFREGDDAHAMYLVRYGTLRIVTGSSILETVRGGGIVGEMAIVEGHVPRSATVIAGTHSQLVEIDEAQFLELVTGMPAFSVTVMRTISRRLRVMNRRFRERNARRA
jgi:CRP/FNR family transcriptional regulator, cyclic AMP receptor protein